MLLLYFFVYNIATKLSILFSETQSKRIQERISGVEQHLGDLCSGIAAYRRKESRVRDKGIFY